MKHVSSEHYVYVWPLCTRIVHWMIALSFMASLYTSWYPHLFRWHLTFGYLFGCVVMFRLLWGFIGPRYATFNAFSLHAYQLKDYFAEKIKNRWRIIGAGHNAASSWFTLLVLCCGFFIVLSGTLLQGTQEASGIAKSLNQAYFSYSFPLENIHGYLSYVLAFWALVHICGVLVEQFYHKTHMLFAMISGYKKARGENVNLTHFHQLIAYTSILIACSISYGIAHSFALSSTQTATFHNELYTEKCGKCHKTYPPFMLPKASWERLMDGLHNHFGEVISDQNISSSEQRLITHFLIDNAAETSTHKLAFKSIASLGTMNPISMSKVPYWRDAHKHLDPAVLKNSTTKNGANCFICHKDFEYGILDNLHIQPSK